MAAVDTGPEQIVTTTVLLVLATIFVGLRFWARYNVAAKYGLDDGLCAAGLVLVYMIGGLNYGMVAHGMGRHAKLVSQDDMEEVLKQLLAFECLYVMAVAAIKLSILAMYLRIFPSRGFKIGAWTIGGATIAWCIAIALVCIFQCNPVSTAWRPWDAGVCIDLRASFIGNAVPNIVGDIAILVMPMKQVWNLHAAMAQKLSLLCTFGLGSFVLIASIYRFSTLMAFDVNDTTYTLATPCTWCVVECACGVICACLPTLRPLAKMVTSRFASLSRSRNKTTSGGGSRGPTELVTIGGTDQHPTRTKSPFARLDDEMGKESTDDLSKHSRAEAHITYASSGDDGDTIDGDRRQSASPGRTTSNRAFV